MAQTNSSLQRWEPAVLSILRIVIGLLILEHGTQKLFHFPQPEQPMDGPGGLPPLMMVTAGSTIPACQYFSFQFCFRSSSASSSST
ncbi:MAG: DoxX family protein [Chthoniobacterales bacterium]